MIADLLHRLRALVLPGRWSRELDDEMRFHIEQDTAARIRAGADPATARREARAAFGGVDRFQEESRDSTGVRPLQDLTADLRFALRSLRRNPGFTATAAGVLAVAIGAATAVFCVVHAVLLADLPYPQPDRLVRVYNQNAPTNIWALSVVDLQALQNDTQTFEAFGGARFASFALAGAGEPEQVTGARVSAGFFRALGVTAGAGRLVTPADERPGAPAVVVVSDAFAAQHFGVPASALGKTITLDGVPSAIVGVLPKGVRELAGLPAPVLAVLRLPTPTRRGPFGYWGVGRLKAGVTLGDAGARLKGLAARVFPIWQSSFKDSDAHYTPIALRQTVIGDSYRQLGLFGGAVLLVLLVAIANVATLMLVRASARVHELSVRATLGASRARLARLVIAECLVLTGGATVAGLALADLAIRTAGRIAPGLARASEIVPDLPTLLVGLGLGIVSGLLISISPVAGVVGGSLSEWKSDLRRSGGSRGSQTIRGVLVASEFALAVPLLLAAALLGNSFLRLQEVSPGYDPSRGFSIGVNLPASRYPDSTLLAFWRSVQARVSQVPGVVAVGISTSPPPDNGGDVNNFNLVAHPVPDGTSEPVAPWPAVSPGFFAALGVPLLEGRLIAESDTGALAPVIVVSRSWAQHYFPNEPVIGQRLISGGCYTCPPDVVVGVVGDVKYLGLAGSGEGVYTPVAQNQGIRGATLFVRTAAANPATFVRPVADALHGLDPQLPLVGVTLEEGLRRTLAEPGRWTRVLGAFAVAAVGLSAMGIFGLMSYVVRRQRREIGVRLALGAEPGRVARMIVGRGMRYVAAGTAVGLALSLLEARWIGALLYGVTPHDPLTLGLVIAGLLGAALAACLLPGLRAARIMPLEAISAE